MSDDHKPEDPEEQDRIVKAGGRVTCDGRVNGGLNLSRAIGTKIAAALSLFHTAILWPLYGAVCVSRHPQLRGLCRSSFTAHVPFLMATSEFRLEEGSIVVLTGVNYTVPIPCVSLYICQVTPCRGTLACFP